MTYYEVELAFRAPATDAESFESFLDDVMDQLATLGVEADLTASLARFTASFHLPADDLGEEGLNRALADLRTALHAADCATHDWPTGVEYRSVRGRSDADLATA